MGDQPYENLIKERKTELCPHINEQLFKDIWMPLFENKDVINITNNILTYISSTIKGIDSVEEFQSFCKNHRIPLKTNNNTKNMSVGLKVLRDQLQFQLPRNNLFDRVQRIHYEYVVDELSKIQNKQQGRNSEAIEKLGVQLKDKYASRRPEKNQWIYLASMNNYQEYKIWSTTQIVESDNNNNCYIWSKLCYDGKDLVNFIQALLKEFKIDAEKNIYRGVMETNLIKTLDSITGQYNELKDFIYDFTKNKFQKSIKKVNVPIAEKDIVKPKQQLEDRLKDKDAKGLPEKNEWIYIASTNDYEKLKVYKIGSTGRLAKRIDSYQTGRIEKFYYIWCAPCCDANELDNYIQALLKDFKISPRKEMYNGIVRTDLIKILEVVTKQYNQSKDVVYNYCIKNKIKESTGIKDTSEELTRKIKQFLNEAASKSINRPTDKIALEGASTAATLKRIDLLKWLRSNSDKINTIKELKLWDEVKSVLKWKSSKTIVEYGGHSFYLLY